MSYPRKICALIIEDEDKVRADYQDIFDNLGMKYDIASPVFACSCEEATRRLDEPNIFQLVILDLGLPFESWAETGTGVDMGQQILDLAVNRDKYPIPVLLVVTARLNQTRPAELTDCLKEGFWHGQLVNKGADDVPREIENGITKALKYCDVGLHLADGGNGQYPTISPREDDLLRRCILSQEGVGADFEWWTAKEVDTGTQDRPKPDWNKVLIGRFILGDGRERSHWTFFKLDPASFADSIQGPASQMHQKLRHVKRLHTCKSRTRSMLVTQCVCTGRPVALHEFLGSKRPNTLSELPRIASEIVAQLKHLGTISDDRRPIRDLLWKHHDRGAIARAWERHAPDDLKGEFTDPLVLFEKIASNQQPIAIKVRSCSHGDLHAKNVAIDVHTSPIQAFIFDAAVMDAAVAVRDLAYLEVSSILFQPVEQTGSVVEQCRVLFEGDFLPPESIDRNASHPRVQNTHKLVYEIRKRAMELSDPTVYAVMVFDSALIELGGLAIQSSRNWINAPVDAALLSSLAARWLSRLFPHLLGD